ncbi:MAG: glycosyltransferase family 2 protein [Eubacterium sp.]|nr:glycosyltransferase family 2 protein [Eubacterium sp.]
MKKISLFTPCFNESGNIEAMYNKVTEIMSALPQYEYEYVIIDNCSTDGTQEILKKIAEKDKRVKVILNLRNFGPSRSGSYGFFQTSGDCSICFAADFQDPPELLPEFIRKWEEGNKVVWGKKTSSDEKPFMYHIRKLYYKVIKWLSDNEQYEDVTGFGLYDREVMDKLIKYSGPTPNFRNMISEFGYEIAFIDYHQPVRKRGKSSYSFFKYLNVAINDIVNTSKVPLRLGTYFGAVVAFLSLLVAIFNVVLKLMYWDTYSAGIASLTAGIFFFSAVQIMFIGIIGEYVGEILARMNKKPLVVEKARYNFEDESEKDTIKKENIEIIDIEKTDIEKTDIENKQ